jgi:hypothetical protein
MKKMARMNYISIILNVNEQEELEGVCKKLFIFTFLTQGEGKWEHFAACYHICLQSKAK